MKKYSFSILISILFFSCAKTNVTALPQTESETLKTPSGFVLQSVQIDNQTGKTSYYHISINPVIQIAFSKKIDSTSVAANVRLKQNTSIIPVNYSYANHDSVIVITPKQALNYITVYSVNINAGLRSKNNVTLNTTYQLNQITTIDSSDKFPQLTINKLLNLIQKQTFNYFWLNGNPISGMSRERYTSGDVCATGGTGFGIMTIPVAINRGFVTRTAGLARTNKIVDFLDVYAHKYHGAFPHWINGTSGATIPFSPHDDGADLVETSYLMEGLLAARQYFNSTTDTNEVHLRNTINKLYQNVEWDWFTNGGQNTLYWHWSPDYGWDTYQQINGWNEAMITYVMAASSPTHPISKAVYTNGWARNGGEKNGASYYGYVLPLGPSNGGPLFFEHYSFLGIDPNGLSDAYANYQTQTTNHTLINYSYCVANPHNYNGYSNECWGLTASDDNISGYSAHEPNNDLGIITPTAAISSLPYTPSQSLAAIKFFYYKLGDKIWGNNGFTDAFNLTNPWFDTDFLAIDQGPEIVMIENYRTGLLWSLFTSCTEVKTGMRNLGFTAPYL